MKSVNLIQPLLPQKKRKIRRWYLFSVLAIVSTISILIILLVPQYLLLSHIKEELSLLQEKTKEHDIVIKQKQDLEQKEALAQKRKTVITGYTNGTKNPHSHIKLLIDACNKGRIETIHITKQNCEIIIRYSCAQDARSTVHLLSNSPLFSTMQLAALTHDVQKKEFRCTLKGKRIYT